MTKRSGRFTSATRSSATPLNLRAVGQHARRVDRREILVDVAPPSDGSKCSRPKPSGSIIAWQVAQIAFSRCCAIRSRIDGIRAAYTPVFSGSGGTFGGGSGGGVPSRLSRIHLPRNTGEVRTGCDVIVRMLPWPSRPRRFSSVSVTRRKWLPLMPGMP